MQIAVTGPTGFIGKNLCMHLTQNQHHVLKITKATEHSMLKKFIDQADFVIHLAATNGQSSEKSFIRNNDQFTKHLCLILSKKTHPIPIIAASSIHANHDTPYGRSKRAGEKHLEQLANTTKHPVAIYRLPNIFGKWSKPNYNSVVATFCYNTAHHLPITINDPNSMIYLSHIDDVINAWMHWLERPKLGLNWPVIKPQYSIRVGQLAKYIQSFPAWRKTNQIGSVGKGLMRALYATYMSYLSPEHFAYPLNSHMDDRGIFSEILKTQNSGQFSVFTAHPGITRGGHYHHSKVEKFLVLQGQACFRFKHMITHKTYTFKSSGEKLMVIETVPGWKHDITNIGKTKMLVLLWSNEIFNPQKPDTINSSLFEESK